MAVAGLVSAGLVTLAGGVVQGSAAEAAPDPVLMAAGDIACDPATTPYNGGAGTATQCHQKAVSDLLVAGAPDVVAMLGDGVYKCGSLAAYRTSYDSSWGRVKDVTRPAPGNHEYQTTASAPQTGCDSSNAGAAGYFGYFGAAAGQPGQGWYSYDLGAWHVVSLNSSCSAVGGCGPTSPQGTWLQADLAANPRACTLAYWHQPLFGGGSNTTTVKPLWDMLSAADADVILTGHQHHYERLQPLTPDGAFDPVRGIREFVVGTGGVNHEAAPTTVPAYTEAINTTIFGALRLTLHDTSYDWSFVPEAGQTWTDSGSASCHGDASDTVAPTKPAALTGQAQSESQVSLSWTASDDAVGVAGYRVFRDGMLIGSSATASYVDTKAPASTTSHYTVDAFDRGGNVSAPSDVADVTTPGAPPVTEVLTIPVSADAHVNANKATTNFGTKTPFVVDGSPRIRSFLRFQVSGVGARTVVGASLRLYTANASAAGGSFSGTNGAAWTESGLTWNNQPVPTSTPVATLGRVTSGSTQTVDVTPLVAGDGTVDIAITSTNADDVGYAAKEATNAARRPVLLVTVQ
jgi:hypothetical protein